jgi:uncharacterized membrane protein
VRFFFWGILALIAVVTTVAAISWVFFRPAGYYPYGFGFFPFGFFGFFWIFAVFWFIRWAFWPWRGYGPRRYWRYGDQAYYILRERYARGEITKEQFDQMTRDLQQRNQGYQNV